MLQPGLFMIIRILGEKEERSSHCHRNCWIIGAYSPI